MAVHIYTQIIHRTTQITTEKHKITTNVEECGPCPIFAIFTLPFALQLRKKHGKTCQGKKPLSQVKKNLSQSTVYILPKQPHITKPTHTQTHPHITKQYKTTTIKIKTYTVQDIPKCNSHNIIKCPQYKVTLMNIAYLSTRNSP